MPTLTMTGVAANASSRGGQQIRRCRVVRSGREAQQRRAESADSTVTCHTNSSRTGTPPSVIGTGRLPS